MLYDLSNCLKPQEQNNEGKHNFLTEIFGGSHLKREFNHYLEIGAKVSPKKKKILFLP